MPSPILLLQFQCNFDSIWVFPDGYEWFETSYNWFQLKFDWLWVVSGSFGQQLMVQGDCRWFGVDGFRQLQMVLGGLLFQQLGYKDINLSIINCAILQLFVTLFIVHLSMLFRIIQNLIKHLRWNLFATTVNGQNSLNISAKVSSQMFERILRNRPQILLLILTECERIN